MLAVIDNYDSFTYNLVQLVRRCDRSADVAIWRNDGLTIADLCQQAPEALIISPGPGAPEQAGICVPAIRALAGLAPILGICLGMQCVVRALGGQITCAKRLVHGKTSEIFHDRRGLHADLANPFSAARYHSLSAWRDSLPEMLCITAWTADGEIMGVQHRYQPLYGIQYHPESFMTADGELVMKRFLGEVTRHIRDTGAPQQLGFMQSGSSTD